MKPYYVVQGILGGLGIMLVLVFMIRILLEFMRSSSSDEPTY